MSIESEGAGLIVTAELIMAIEGYNLVGRKGLDDGIDFVASQTGSDDKMLLRIITEPKSSSGIVGIETVREMSEKLEREDCDKGVLISERFSKAAKEEMRREGIQMVSKKSTLRFKPLRLYLTMQEYIKDLCQTKCGYIPEKESDCKGKDSKERYSCKIRLINDNASFHFERGWTHLLQRDFERLIELHNWMNNSEIDS